MSYVDLTDVVPAPERHSGYLVDLSSVIFEEGETPTSWVHALSLGEFKHPLWGKIKMTADRIRRFAANVNNGVRGIDLAIDYNHRAGEEAAGWVRQAEARGDGLWLLVEWTEKAAERIRNKEFRYFSSEFVDEWVSETGQKFKDVILGGGLTNRPFLKNLLPVNLSELYPEGKEKEKENESMKLNEQLREALELSEDATEQDALDAIKALQETEETPPKEEPPVAPTDPEIAKLLEESPQVKALVDEVAELRAARHFDEVRRLTESWSTHSTKKFALPPAATTKLEELLQSTGSEVHAKLSEAIDAILENGLVSLEEKGGRKPPGEPGEDSATAEVMSRVKKLQEDNESMTFADAYAEVSRDEELWTRYRKETIAGHISEEVSE